MIPISHLFSVRRKALKRKMWFKVLEKEERIIVNLAIRCVKKVRSTLLVKIMKHIINKLENAMKSETNKFIESVGPKLAKKMADIAVSWGNNQAKEWASNLKFARYLAITKMNTPKIFKA